MFKKLKDKKGFPLVELIVVLVILAILAALLVPALTGYIDKANNEKIIATTRQVVMAAQTEASEAYGKNSSGKLTDNGNDLTIKTGEAIGTTAVTIDKIASLAEVGTVATDGTITGANGVTYIEVTLAGTNGKVKSVVVKQSGKQCTYTADTTGNASPYTVVNE